MIFQIKTYFQKTAIAIYSRVVAAFRPSSDIEQFIVSKNPKTASDVEHWERIFRNGRYY